MTDSYKKAIEDAKGRLLDLVDQRDKIRAKIDRTIRAVQALAYMLDSPEETSRELVELDEIIGPGGLSDAVRTVLASPGRKRMTPVEVRDALVKSGFNLSVYANPLAAIHTTLKRIVKADEAIMAIVDDETAYQWKGTAFGGALRRARMRAFAGKTNYGASGSLANTILKKPE